MASERTHRAVGHRFRRFVLWQMWKHVKTTCDKLTETNAELTYTNKELVKTNSNLVSSINVKLDKLIEKIK